MEVNQGKSNLGYRRKPISPPTLPSDSLASLTSLSSEEGGYYREKGGEVELEKRGEGMFREYGTVDAFPNIGTAWKHYRTCITFQCQYPYDYRPSRDETEGSRDRARIDHC